MKKHFQNTKQNYVIFCFLMVKLFATILFLFTDSFLIAFSHLLPWFFFIISIYTPNGLLFLALGLLTFSLFVVSTVLLLINKRSAGFASIVLIVFCLVDATSVISMPVFASLSFVFNVALALMLIVLRRSKPNAPTIVHNIDPANI